MKKLLILLLQLSALATYAQTDSLKPAYLRFPTIPPIQLLQLDSTTILTKDQLHKNRPVLLMYFSPDCDHCQHQMDDIMKDIDAFKNIQLVLATVQPFEMMKAFHEKYQLDKHSNIFLGRDIKYTLPPFFQMRNLPYLALYNRKGDLITTFEGNVKTKKLIDAFSK
ncbi:MAG TPA: redoxin domain-containing protein [Chitinophagaceae bacterium]